MTQSAGSPRGQRSASDPRPGAPRPGKRILFLVVMSTFLLPSQLAAVLQFVIMTGLDRVDELKAVIVPSPAGAFDVFWLRQFFQSSVRTELIEAAAIDG